MKLSKNPYKGTRDFFPEQMRLRKQVFGKLEQIVESFGYEPYDGPMLEPFALYAAKTGEEIVNDQLYSFEDQGGRKMAMRPEMTPTLARMVSQRQRELAKPIRWYSLPNLWRYENPQRGRLREHWQLNVDIFGVDGMDAEIEIMILAMEILLSFGATKDMFQLHFNHRGLMDTLLDKVLELDPAMRHKTAKAIDKMKKISTQDFESILVQAGLSISQISILQSFLEITFEQIPQKFPLLQNIWHYLQEMKNVLEEAGYGDFLVYAPQIMRGFDYYTGTVFEIFDLNENNRRSLYGGGRYDNLVGLFGGQSLSGIGFGMGDVTFFDFLEAHNLTPISHKPLTVMLGIFPETKKQDIWRIVKKIQKQGIGVEIPWEVPKLGKQLQIAQKKGLQNVLLLDDTYLVQNRLLWKNLATGIQKDVAIEQILDIFELDSI